MQEEQSLLRNHRGINSRRLKERSFCSSQQSPEQQLSKVSICSFNKILNKPEGEGSVLKLMETDWTEASSSRGGSWHCPRSRRPHPAGPSGARGSVLTVASAELLGLSQEQGNVGWGARFCRVAPRIQHETILKRTGITCNFKVMAVTEASLRHSLQPVLNYLGRRSAFTYPLVSYRVFPALPGRAPTLPPPAGTRRPHA